MRALPTLLALLPLFAVAESAVLKDVEFSITADVGFGNEVCVLGDHPLLGGGNPLRAPKLAWTPGNVWRGRIALEAATSFTCRYISRSYAVANWPSTSNQTPLGSPFPMTSPDHPLPPWTAKTVLYRTSWPEPRLLYRDMTHNGAWTDAAMTVVAPGRVPGEQTFGVTGLAASGALLEFVFHNGGGLYDNAPAPPSGTAQGAAPAVPAPYQGLGGPYNYRTALDVMLVQDGQVFNYVPPSSVSAPRTEVRAIGSTAPNIPGRTVTLLLPRGYDQNTTKHYPVVLFHDGQNVFFPGGPFGTWDADRIATYETAQGRMREAILVAIPNGNDIGSNRLNEYLPDGDSIEYAGTPYTGRAAAYLQFILDNLMPALDTHYRTLGDAPNTVVAGSSMGGLVTDYLTLERSDRFGAAGIFSPAYWAAPNWVAARDAAAKRALRRYLYMGTAESSTGESSSQIYWSGALQACDTWIRAGHAINGDLVFEGGAGATHTESAWSLRLPPFFQFALEPTREANPLALALYPPSIRVTSVGGSPPSARVAYPALMGVTQELETGGNLAAWDATPLPAGSELWAEREVEVPADVPAGSTWYGRLKNTTW